MAQPIPAATAKRRRLPLIGAIIILAIGGAVALRIYARPPVENALHGDQEDAADALPELLARTPAPDRTALLLKSAQEPYDGLRYAAVDALGKTKGAAATDAIEAAFQDSSAEVRKRALELLPERDPERGFRLQLAALRDEDTWVRQDAIALISVQVGRKNSRVDSRCIPLLIKTLDDSEPSVVSSTANLLRKLTGEPIRVSGRDSAAAQHDAVVKWRQWWETHKAMYADVKPEYTDPAPRPPTRAADAPMFSLLDIEGGTVNRTTLKGRLTLLNFWGTWCAPCMVELPDLIKLDAAYRDRGVDIIGIAVAETNGETGLRRWCAEHGVHYRQSLATDAIQSAFGHIHEEPVSILIDAQGKIRRRWDGERDFATFRNALDNLLKESKEAK